jgi:hypothetical protein
LKPKVSDEVISASNQIVKDLYHPGSTSEDVKPNDRPRNLRSATRSGAHSEPCPATSKGIFTSCSDRLKISVLEKELPGRLLTTVSRASREAISPTSDPFQLVTYLTPTQCAGPYINRFWRSTLKRPLYSYHFRPALCKPHFAFSRQTRLSGLNVSELRYCLGQINTRIRRWQPLASGRSVSRVSRRRLLD